MSMTVVGVAHDAGGARAIIPVLEELVRRGVSTEALVAGPAATLWPAECAGVQFHSVPDGLSLDAAMGLLDRARTGAVLSACGLYNRLEHTVRCAARASGVPCVGVLDSWLNYAERFRRTEHGRHVPSVPNIVCVMDELSRRGAVEAGLDPAQVVIAGAPNLERSVQLAKAVSADRGRLRAALGIDPDCYVIVFFSEPFVTAPDGGRFEGEGALCDPCGESLYGYTAEQILDIVLDELNVQNRAAARRAHVIVKAHPSEWSAPLTTVVSKHASEWTRADVRANEPPAMWIGLADAVVGMMTIALLEAALAGRPTLSVQIGLTESGMDDPCFSVRLGYTPAVYTRAALSLEIRRLFAARSNGQPSPASAPIALDGSAARVADIVLGARRCV